MAASKHLTDAAEFLTDAAHLMRIRSPHVSAHLMSYRNGLLAHHDLSLSDVQRQRVCGACGNIHVPGNGSSVKIEARKSVRKKNRPTTADKTAPVEGSVKLTSCGLCHQPTRTKLGAPGPAVRRKSNRVPKAKQPVSGNNTQKPTVNANSKKRAKNRKAGLQALLSGQQQQSPSPLSLADFMK